MTNIADTIEHDGQAAIVTGVNDDGTVNLRVFGTDPTAAGDLYLSNVELDGEQGNDQPTGDVLDVAPPAPATAPEQQSDADRIAELEAELAAAREQAAAAGQPYEQPRTDTPPA